MDRHNIKFKMSYKCITTNTSAIWQQVAGVRWTNIKILKKYIKKIRNKND